MKKICLLVLCLPLLFYAQEHHEIEVKGEKIPLNFDSKKEIWVIEGEALSHLPSMNLADLLRIAANLSFVQRGLFQSDAQGLGFNQEQFTILVDGIPVNNSQTGHHNLVLPFHKENIERIEILRGGSSPLYSSSGPGGVINIITSRKNAFHAGLASFKTVDASLTLGGDRLFFSSGFKSTGGHMEGIDGSEYFCRAGIRLPFKNNVIDIRGSWVLSKFGAFNFYAPFPSFENLSKIWGSLDWRTELSRSTSLFVKSSVRYSKDIFHLYREDPDRFSNTHHTIQNLLETGLIQSGDSLSACLGLSAFSDSINSSGIRNGETGPALGNHGRSLVSLFAEAGGETDTFLLSGGLRLTGGTYSGISGHALLGAHLGDSCKISFSANRTFRVPTYTELYYSDPAHLSDPGLCPETSWGGDLHFQHKSGRLGNFSLRTFFHITENLIDWVWSPEKNQWNGDNIREGKHYGFESGYGFSGEFLQINILYTFQKALFKKDILLKNMKYNTYFPQHSLSVLFRKNFQIFSIYTTLKMEQEKDVPKPAVFFNIKVSKELGNVHLFAEVLNLFNNRLEKIPGLPEAPRSFSLGAGYAFTN